MYEEALNRQSLENQTLRSLNEQLTHRCQQGERELEKFQRQLAPNGNLAEQLGQLFPDFKIQLTVQLCSSSGETLNPKSLCLQLFASLVKGSLTIKGEGRSGAELQERLKLAASAAGIKFPKDTSDT